MDDIFNRAINLILKDDPKMILKGILLYGLYLVVKLILIIFWGGIGALILEFLFRISR